MCSLEHGTALALREVPAGYDIRPAVRDLGSRAVFKGSPAEGIEEIDMLSHQAPTGSHRIAITTFLSTMVLLSMPLVASAQVPFFIDGAVPDANCCAEFQDPAGSVSELGPVNSSTTKLTTISTASPPMLGFTNPNGSTDLATIWLGTEADQNGDL